MLQPTVYSTYVARRFIFYSTRVRTQARKNKNILLYSERRRDECTLHTILDFHYSQNNNFAIADCIANCDGQMFDIELRAQNAFVHPNTNQFCYLMLELFFFFRCCILCLKLLPLSAPVKAIMILLRMLDGLCCRKFRKFAVIAVHGARI